MLAAGLQLCFSTELSLIYSTELIPTNEQRSIPSLHCITHMLLCHAVPKKQ